jgi:predicted TIM-barrel fold metal-dependent hydrolase
MKYSVISADCHIIEHRDVFTARMPAHLRERAPRVVRCADGGDGWTWNGKLPSKSFGIEAVAGQGGDSKTFKPSGLKWEEIRPGNYDGAAHVADMAVDGVDASVVFPNVSMYSFLEPDREYGLAVMRAYNDWLLEDFSSVDPARLIGLPELPVNDGPEVAIAELERCLKKGAKAFFIPGIPQRQPYCDLVYDPVWQAASDAGVPLVMHRTHGGQSESALFSRTAMPGFAVAGIAIRFFSAIEPFTLMIMTGVFQRHPRLKIVDAEVNCGWVPFWRETMDGLWARQRVWENFPFEGKPSDFLGRNVFVTTLDDRVGFETMRTDKQMADMTMYSSDYPHSVSLWPNSSKYIAELTKGYDAATKAKVLAGNAARVFNLT